MYLSNQAKQRASLVAAGLQQTHLSPAARFQLFNKVHTGVLPLQLLLHPVSCFDKACPKLTLCETSVALLTWLESTDSLQGTVEGKGEEEHSSHTYKPQNLLLFLGVLS